MTSPYLYKLFISFSTNFLLLILKTSGVISQFAWGEGIIYFLHTYLLYFRKLAKNTVANGYGDVWQSIFWVVRGGHLNLGKGLLALNLPPPLHHHHQMAPLLKTRDLLRLTALSQTIGRLSVRTD